MTFENFNTESCFISKSHLKAVCAADSHNIPISFNGVGKIYQRMDENLA